MPTTIMGACNKVTTTTFSATGTANGPTKGQALDRARSQAQTLLDSYTFGLTKCPAECAVVSVDSDPDYDSKAPAYETVSDAPGVFVCTVEVSRVITLTCTDPNAASAPG